jgi:hypothetical protein
MPTPA